jgi:hypothetical protein
MDWSVDGFCPASGRFHLMTSIRTRIGRRTVGSSSLNLFRSVAGCSGSGKTYASMLLLRQLFDAAGGGPETDAFKHLAAAFTVLRSLGSAKTQANSESSRIVSRQPGRTGQQRVSMATRPFVISAFSFF